MNNIKKYKKEEEQNTSTCSCFVRHLSVSKVLFVVFLEEKAKKKFPKNCEIFLLKLGETLLVIKRLEIITRLNWQVLLYKN